MAILPLFDYDARYQFVRRDPFNLKLSGEATAKADPGFPGFDELERARKCGAS